MRRRWLGAIPLSLAALMVRADRAGADTLEAYGNGVLKDSVAINTMWVLDDRRARAVHAGGLRDARDRLLAREERRHRRGEDPDQPLDRGHLLLGRGLCLCVRHRQLARET